MKLTTDQMLAKYGAPGDEKNFGTIGIPYPMRLAWDPHIVVKRITCHRGVAERLIKVFDDILSEYGLEKIQELGIDLYGGCFMNRPKRGYEKLYAEALKDENEALAASYLSAHAWAVAIDLDPARNQLHETRRTARFANDEYKEMIAIFYRHKFLSYGREFNYDWMHFETSI